MLNMAKAFVYRNLHKKCWSIRHEGKVIAHAPRVFLWDGEFQVSEFGNARVRKEKRKNVHAYVVADLEDVWVSNDTTLLNDNTGLFKFDLLKKLGETNTKRVTYQPYKMKSFKEVESDKPVFAATTVYLTARSSVYTQDMSPPNLRRRLKEKGVDNG